MSNAAIFAAVAAAATECSGETCIVPSETLYLECGDSFSLQCLADNNCVDYEKLSGFSLNYSALYGSQPADFNRLSLPQTHRKLRALLASGVR